MSYIIKVNGTKIRACRSFNEAKRLARIYKGEICRTKEMPMPRAASLRFNDSAYAKAEMYIAIANGNNFHKTFIKKGESLWH